MENGEIIEIVNVFSYLGIVFTARGSLNQTKITLAGQSSKTIININKQLFNFTNISTKHILELFELVLPILNYGCEQMILSAFIHCIINTF